MHEKERNHLIMLLFWRISIVKPYEDGVRSYLSEKSIPISELVGSFPFGPMIVS